MTTPTNYQNDDWYLIANQDGLAIKIRNSISLGEDGQGGLCLDSRTAAERWLTLTLDDGHLLVSELAAAAGLSQGKDWSVDAAGLVLARGTLLEFPNNEVYVSQSLSRGQVHMQVAVNYDPRAELQAEESVAHLEQAVLEARPATAAAAPKIGAPREQELGSDGVIVVPEIPDEMRYAPRPYRTNRRRFGVVIGAGAIVVAALAGLIVQQQQTPSLHDEAPQLEVVAPASEPLLEEPAQTEVEGPSDEVAPDESVERTVTATILPLDSAEVDLQTASEATITATAADVTADEPLPVAAALDEAATLLADGYLTWPERNAMTILSAVLEAAPNDPRALALREELAATLMAEAQAAHADGFTDSAYRMVQQILTFHPEHGPALVLASRWRHSE